MTITTKEKDLFNSVVRSAGLVFEYKETKYAEVVLNPVTEKYEAAEGKAPVTRYSIVSKQLPDIPLTNTNLERLKELLVGYVIRIVNFKAISENVVVRGSATALYTHGFFQEGNEIQVATKDRWNKLYVRMEPTPRNTTNAPKPAHRFFAESEEGFTELVKLLARNGRVKEVTSSEVFNGIDLKTGLERS